MGADAIYVYYGVKRTVLAGSEEDALLDNAKHPIFDTAFDHKLHVAWGRLTDGEDTFLLVGHEFGCFGVEGYHEASVSPDELGKIIERTPTRLKAAGFDEDPGLIFQLNAQY